MAYCRVSIRRTLPDLRQSIVLTAIWAVFFSALIDHIPVFTWYSNYGVNAFRDYGLQGYGKRRYIIKLLPLKLL
mgnify:CR=1 FL=1